MKLTDFFSEIGTVGEPKPDIDKLALAKATVQTIIPDLKGVVNIPGNLLQGIGGILQGGGANTNQPAGTNQAPATNQPPVTTTNRGPVNNILNKFLGPGTK